LNLCLKRQLDSCWRKSVQMRVCHLQICHCNRHSVMAGSTISPPSKQPARNMTLPLLTCYRICNFSGKKSIRSTKH
jgi:hypothetical protein